MNFHHTTLPNGLTVVAETDDNAHSAAIGFFVKTGARDERSELMGVSHFLEHMMFKGTETRSAEDVDREFDGLGASHNAFTTSELTAFYAHTLPEYIEEAETILSDIMRPSIRVKDFDDEKKVILEEIAMYRDQPFWILYERAMEVYYRHHPLSHRVLGTNDTVAGMQRDAMMDYFTSRYSADNTVVALAGQVDFDRMAARIADHCSHWQRTDAAREYAPANHTPETFHVHHDSVARHYMLMAAPAPAMSDDRRYAAGILAQILGDSEGSRLYWALIETGLADEAQAQYDSRDGLGEYLLYTSCSPEEAEQVEAVVRNQVDALVDSITEDDLVRVRSRIATAATLHSELPAGRMRRLGHLWTYTGEYRPLESELERINAVTLDELRNVHDDFPLTPVVTGHLGP